MNESPRTLRSRPEARTPLFRPSAARLVTRWPLALLAALSILGPSAVRAQTPMTDPAAQTRQTAGPVRRLSIEEAVALALDQNLDLQVERFNPQIDVYTISVARSGWTPNFTSSVNTRDSNVPTDSFLAGALDTLTEDRFTSSLGVGQLLPWGGSYNLGWDSNRIESNNQSLNRNPQLNSSFFVNFTQPLLRNFGIDPTRQQIQLGEKNREISNVQLQQSVSVTTRIVRNSYYDLMFTIANLRVQQQSLDLAQRSLRENRARVEIGTMAPIDIVEAEAEVAQREENVIVAAAQIARAEDRLRALVFDPSTPDFWTMTIEPTDTVTFQPIVVDTDAAVRTALSRRTDIVTLRKQAELSDVNVRFFRNQQYPDINAQVNYSGIGRGGTQFQREGGILGPIIPDSIIQRSYGSVLGDAFGNAYPTWSLALQVNYPIGTSSAEASLARARLQTSQVQKDLQSQELQVATQVRDFARSVDTNGKRVEATRAARALSERRLEAEEKKFTAGMTTPFLVFQAQRDLNQSRNNELQALLDYAKSVVDFETSQESPLTTPQIAGSLSTLTNTTSGTTGSTGTVRQQ